MREIKFRAKSGTQWRYGDLYHNEHGELMIYEPQSRGGTLDGVPFDGWQIKVDPETVGQFTGLSDCNGKEIYEGDILRFAPPWRWVEDERRNGVVVYKCYGFRIEYLDTSEALFNLAANDVPYTIIGNIHDSPELLEADHERD